MSEGVKPKTPAISFTGDTDSNRGCPDDFGLIAGGVKSLDIEGLKAEHDRYKKALEEIARGCSLEMYQNLLEADAYHDDVAYPGYQAKQIAEQALKGGGE